MSSIENIRVGDIIMPTEYRYQEEKFFPPEWEAKYQPEIRPLSTQPLLVVSIDAPFILCEQLVTTVGGAYVVDSRYVSWTKISKRFVREYCRMNELELHDKFRTKITDEQERSSSDKLCPLCDEKMSDMLGGDKRWLPTCRNCQVQLVPMSSVKA